MARLTLILGVLATVVYLLDGFRFALNEWRNWRNKSKWLAVIVLLLVPGPAWATLWYVDGTASGANNGTSWANAWATRAAITGLSAGDTVYFSGGAAGQSYNSAPDWFPPSGSAGGGPITLAVGQDAGHNGMVTFVQSGAPTAANAFVYADSLSYFTVNGEVSGQRRMTFSGFGHVCYTQNRNDRHMRFLYYESGNSMAFNCQGSYMELAYSKMTMTVQFGPDYAVTEFGTTAGAGGYGINSFHHNILMLPRRGIAASAGEGFDGLEWIFNADIYNNTFIGYVTGSYTGNQHADGMQTSGNYLRIYNNYFENILNAGIYLEWGIVGDCYDHHDFKIYNNVFKWDDANVLDWGTYGMTIGSHVACPSNSMYNVLIANNTFIGSQSGQRGGRINFDGAMPIGSGVYIVNNLYYNITTAMQVEGIGSFTESNNSDIGTTNKSFVSNALYASNDFHLTAGATAAINQGITPAPSYLTSVYTVDADTNGRVDTWDLGAYEFGSGTADSPVVIARVLRWMEVAAFVTGMGWHFRKPLMAVCLAVLSIGGTMVQLAPKSYDTVKVVSRDSAVKVLTVLNHLTKPKG